jgi:hypothetical protein
MRLLLQLCFVGAALGRRLVGPSLVDVASLEAYARVQRPPVNRVPVTVRGPGSTADARRQFWSQSRSCWKPPPSDPGWTLGGMRPYEYVRPYELAGWKKRRRPRPVTILFWSPANWFVPSFRARLSSPHISHLPTDTSWKTSRLGIV